MVIREADLSDIPDMFHIRVSVLENAMTLEELAESNITPTSAVERLKTSYKGWMAELDGESVGFCVADSGRSCIWALFVLPGFEDKGLGRGLLEPAVEWLWETGASEIWLTTGPDTRAEGFYRHLGWKREGLTDSNEVRFTLQKLSA